MFSASSRRIVVEASGVERNSAERALSFPAVVDGAGAGAAAGPGDFFAAASNKNDGARRRTTSSLFGASKKQVLLIARPFSCRVSLSIHGLLIEKKRKGREKGERGRVMR